MPNRFPPIDTASPEGLLAIGGSLDLDTLKEAYSLGIFPWPISKDSPLTWFSPDPRGIIKVSELHISKSFSKFIQKNSFKIKFNTCFKTVVENCANMKRKHEKGTWISQEIINGYDTLFQNKLAYSIEVFNEEKLVGGLYGVCMGEMITGESMFHTEANASKLALYNLIQILKKNNIKILDTQMVSPIVESFGGVEVERSFFLNYINTLNKQYPLREDLFH